MSYLVVGLGNPSPQYDRTRHNAGRETVQTWLTRRDSIPFSTGLNPSNVPNFSGEVYRGKVNGTDVFISSNLGTFMNESGPAVQTLLSYFKIPTEKLIIVHDDLAFPLGVVRMQKDISSGGHNGVQSIIDALGTQDFTRLRLGVESRPDHQLPSEDFVLQKVSEAEYQQMFDMYHRAGEVLTNLLENGLENTMDKFH